MRATSNAKKESNDKSNATRTVIRHISQRMLRRIKASQKNERCKERNKHNESERCANNENIRTAS